MTLCNQHSGIEQQVTAIRRDIADLKKTVRWMTAAILGLALSVGGSEYVSKLFAVSVSAADTGKDHK